MKYGDKHYVNNLEQSGYKSSFISLPHHGSCKRNHVI